MHRTAALFVLALLQLTTAFGPFAHSLHPEIDMATISAPSQPVEPTPLPQVEASPISRSLSHALPSIATTLLSSPTQTLLEHEHADLKPRQGAPVITPPAALPANPDQISPVTIYEIDSVPPGGGAPVKVDIAYTQTFAEVPDQWPVAGQGSIGLGTIVGKVGVVKTKRFVPFVVEESVVGTRTVSFTA